MSTVTLDFDQTEVATLRKAYENAQAAMSDGHSMPFAIRDLIDNIEKQFKPDEPTGLGAVVRDKRGRVYVRYTNLNGDVWPWRMVTKEPVAAMRYCEIDAVEVLSEGVDQ
jgi:hypothetical protein